MRVLRTRTITPESWARACPDSEYGLCTGIYADDEWELQEFLDRVKTARELGVKNFNFYNYGFVPYENFGWIKEGLEAYH